MSTFLKPISQNFSEPFAHQVLMKFLLLISKYPKELPPGHFQSPTIGIPRSGETPARKELTSPTQTPTDTNPGSDTCGDEVLDLFTYRSSIEQSINELHDDMKELQTEVESAREYVQRMQEKYCRAPAQTIGNGKQCGNCHLRLDHTARQCHIEKCVTSQQCGDVSKHPEEKSILEGANDHLKRLEKNLREKNVGFRDEAEGNRFCQNSFSHAEDKRPFDQ
ncbi:uncharacterized protein LOC128175086 [Crassostrea angulata]|uniref:uncharacterized protein LOC128175086 n=1 Tax=Magallana angulata TaxID=2784310 RepID=UPI0022B1D0DB|nr:uncharacterized protein LOC128175086 [Crassostrea angulata]